MIDNNHFAIDVSHSSTKTIERNVCVNLALLNRRDRS